MVTRDVEPFLKQTRIMGDNETIDGVIRRVFSTIATTDMNFGIDEAATVAFSDRLKQYFKEDVIVPSTPILTNVGRYTDKPASACSVPPLTAGMSLAELENLVNDYHKKGMGTGFNFDDSVDPVGDLLALNRLAVMEVERDELDRPVGNMGILSVDHPKVLEFARVKAGKLRNLDWKFNLSVNLKENFMDAVRRKTSYRLRDGTVIDACGLLETIVSNAHTCGDPGLLFLERFEEGNVIPHLGKYISLAPCGEIPMASGETCQFGYINLGKFATDTGIDYDALRGVVHDVVHMLDNTLEISRANIGNPHSKDIMTRKRKIGVGLCGYSDLLFQLGMAYDGDEARTLAEDIMSFINYESKRASVTLAKERGAFPAFGDEQTRRERIIGAYRGTSTNSVSAEDWEALQQDIDTYGIRNVTTTALPPTGRSSLVIGASASIEPAFRLTSNDVFRTSLKRLAIAHDYEGRLEDIYAVVDETGSVENTDLPPVIKSIYRTCLEIDPQAHISMVAAFQKYTDDSIAKTVNLPKDCTPHDITRTYLQAYDQGLKGITIFRDGSKNQPLKLRGKP